MPLCYLQADNACGMPFRRAGLGYRVILPEQSGMMRGLCCPTAMLLHLMDCERADTAEDISFAHVRAWVSGVQIPSSIEKVAEIDAHIGCAMSGLTADARTLIDHGRVEAQVFPSHPESNVVRRQLCQANDLHPASLAKPIC
jgi:hypothetical protein